MEGGNPMKPKLKFKKTKRDNNTGKTGTSKQVVYLCQAVERWPLLSRQYWLPM
jgi:hypothetical protein